MYTELYIEALLGGEQLADQAWDLWDAGVITDEVAALAWCRAASNGRFTPDSCRSTIITPKGRL